MFLENIAETLYKNNEMVLVISFVLLLLSAFFACRTLNGKETDHDAS